MSSDNTLYPFTNCLNGNHDRDCSGAVNLLTRALRTKYTDLMSLLFEFDTLMNAMIKPFMHPYAHIVFPTNSLKLEVVHRFVYMVKLLYCDEFNIDATRYRLKSILERFTKFGEAFILDDIRVVQSRIVGGEYFYYKETSVVFALVEKYIESLLRRCGDIISGNDDFSILVDLHKMATDTEEMVLYKCNANFTASLNGDYSVPERLLDFELIVEFYIKYLGLNFNFLNNDNQDNMNEWIESEFEPFYCVVCKRSRDYEIDTCKPTDFWNDSDDSEN